MHLPDLQAIFIHDPKKEIYSTIETDSHLNNYLISQKKYIWALRSSKLFYYTFDYD